MSSYDKQKKQTIVEQIENILKNENFGKTWIGFPKEIDKKIYFSAKGRDLDIIKMFRDIFGGTSIAGSVKSISKKIFWKKNGGYSIVYTIEEMQNILKEIEENLSDPEGD